MMCVAFISLLSLLQGRIFIDRDPTHFGLILNYLRDGVCILPADSQGLQEVLQEAEFYQVWCMLFNNADAHQYDMHLASDSSCSWSHAGLA